MAERSGVKRALTLQDALQSLDSRIRDFIGNNETSVWSFTYAPYGKDFRIKVMFHKNGYTITGGTLEKGEVNPLLFKSD